MDEFVYSVRPDLFFTQVSTKFSILQLRDLLMLTILLQQKVPHGYNTLDTFCRAPCLNISLKSRDAC